MLAAFGLCWGIGAIGFGLGIAAVGLALGYAIIMGLVVLVWLREGWLALLIGGSLVCVILISTTVGAVVPIVFDRLKIDPALATGPFVTTANDVLGIIVYLSMAEIIIPKVR